MTPGPKSPEAVDKFVGARVRALRLLRGRSQQWLARACGVTFQQIQKYETGTNRIGASRLFQIAQFLEVEPGYFFQGLQADMRADVREAAAEIQQLMASVDLELLGAIARLPAADIAALRTIVRSLAQTEPQAALVIPAEALQLPPRKVSSAEEIAARRAARRERLGGQ